MSRSHGKIALLMLAVRSQCLAGPQSALDPAGSQADRIASLWWFFLILLGVIFVLVMGLALLALFRSRGVGQGSSEGIRPASAETERTLSRRVGAAAVLSTVILFGLIVMSVSTGKSMSESSVPSGAMTIEVTGNQWWWNVRYMDSDASQVFVTANEIHIPVGRPVLIRGTSQDVIHSFWIPNLHGKRDLIPSRITTEWLQADHPGRFRGQCAEFCGLQHAHMAMWVIAEPDADYRQWKQNQLRPGAEPSTPSQQQGRQVFLDNACVFCHSIQGTTAAGQTAPDLTHLASRSTIAAGTLANNRGNLAGWIADPQSIKPGNHMATVPLRSEEMQPLLDYLESLK